MTSQSPTAEPPTTITGRRRARYGQVHITPTHVNSPAQWDDNPGIEWWNFDLTLSYEEHNATPAPKPALIARASLIRVDCSRCEEIAYELDQFSYDLCRIGSAIEESSDELNELYDLDIGGGMNGTILIAEDVVVDKFWRGKRLGPSLVTFAAELLRADATFLMPYGLHTRLDANGECYTDYWSPRPGADVQKKVRKAWSKEGFAEVCDGIYWTQNIPEGNRALDKRTTVARDRFEKLTMQVDDRRTKSWWWRRIARQQTSQGTEAT